MAVTGVAAASAADGPEASTAEREQLAHLAQEFEAMFISEMMRGMRQSLLSEEEDQGLGSATMTDTFDAEFGRSMSNAGGLGLARVMIEGLKTQLGDGGAGPAASGTPNSAAAMVAPSTMAPPNATAALGMAAMLAPNPGAAAGAGVATVAPTAAAAPATARATAAPNVVATTGTVPRMGAPRAAFVARPALSAVAPSALPPASTVLTLSAPTSDPSGDAEVDIPASSDGADAPVASPVSAIGASASAGVQFRTLPGPVTSKFGWRSDPFTGRPQFHAGTDIRLAYGHDVQSVAAGRVKSVGEESGYGLTVVIDHGQGLETRYAHLSNASVKAGDVGDSGQVVARSGNSGRSTGPHLHLEARRNGRAVEMAALLKSPGIRADSYADDRTIVRSGHED